jgi:hypothetical protein
MGIRFSGTRDEQERELGCRGGAIDEDRDYTTFSTVLSLERLVLLFEPDKLIFVFLISIRNAAGRQAGILLTASRRTWFPPGTYVEAHLVIIERANN